MSTIRLITIGVIIMFAMTAGVVLSTSKRATKSHFFPARDYQIEIHFDTIWVYDGDKLVDKYVSNWKEHFDSVVMKDNDLKTY